MFERLSVLTLTCFSTMAVVLSCDNDTKTNSIALAGRWEIVKGYRNQQETHTLDGTYFRFGNDGKMQTNLPIGPEEPMDYTVNHNEIRQKSTPPIKYTILNLTDSSLVLNLELRGMQFEMHFRRALEEAPQEEVVPENSSELDTL